MERLSSPSAPASGCLRGESWGAIFVTIHTFSEGGTNDTEALITAQGPLSKEIRLRSWSPPAIEDFVCYSATATFFVDVAEEDSISGTPAEV
jgi:hypothetical protein